MARKARDRLRRAVGYTPAKRRRRALRHRMPSFSPHGSKLYSNVLLCRSTLLMMGVMQTWTVDKTCDIQTPAAILQQFSTSRSSHEIGSETKAGESAILKNRLELTAEDT